MLGLLLDVNIQNHAAHIRRLWAELMLADELRESGVQVLTLADANLPQDLDDQALWNRCQEQNFVLFTENRNQEGPDSLQTALDGHWRDGCLPVLTLSSKTKLVNDHAYAANVAADVADVMFGIAQDDQFRDQARIWVPR